MIPFSSMLRQLMSSKDTTMNELSRAAMIDRSTLYKITNGTRKPSSSDVVARIADCLRLNRKERSDLRDAYYLTVLGPARFYGGRNITELLNQLGSRRSAAALPFTGFTENILPNRENHIVLCDADDIRRSLFCAMTDAGISKAGEIRLFTSALTPAMISMLRYTCATFPDLQVEHLIVFDNAKNIAEDGHLYNLEVLNGILPLIASHKNYHVRCVYADISSLRSFSTMPGEILITDRACITYSREIDHAILSTDPDIFAMWSEIFDNLNDSAYDYFTDLSPELFFADVQHVIQADRPKAQHYVLNPGLCVVLLLDPETDMDLPARVLHFPDEQMKEDFIARFTDYLPKQKALLDSQADSLTQLCTRQGVEYFTKTGYINEISSAISNPLSYADRLKFLKRWRALYEAGRFVLLDFPFLRRDACVCLCSTPKDLHLQISAEDGLFLTERVQEPGITTLFYWYCEFLSKEYSMERGAALAFFDDCARYLAKKAETAGDFPA